MRMRLAHCSLIATMSSLWWVGAAGAPLPEVIVRIYDASGAHGQGWDSALNAARQTLADASIDVVWRHCPGGRFAHPLAPGELAVRLARSPAPVRATVPAVLGDALVDRHEASGVLASVYVDTVQHLALKTEADSQLLLGRVIAHELGHLLLGSTRHAQVGLMRAAWLHREIRRNHRRDWAFTPIEVTTMVKRAEAKSGDRQDRGLAANGGASLASGRLDSELGDGAACDRSTTMSGWTPGD